jgi:hypothetical protein
MRPPVDERSIRAFDRLVEPSRLRSLYDQIEPYLYHYPAIDPAVFRRKLDALLGDGPQRRAGGLGS